MNNITTYFFESYRYLNEGKWFKKAMAWFVICKCLYWILSFRILFATENIIYHNSVHLPLWKNAAFFLFNHPTSAWSAFFIALTLLSALLILILKRFHSVAFLVLWFTVSNINNNIFCTMTGGDSLLQLLLFFCIFLSNGEGSENPLRADLKTAFHNFGIKAIQIQICIVYFLNGLAKLQDADWLGGNAVADSLALEEFSLPFMYHANTSLCSFLSYSVMIYQLLFPVLVWIRKIKKWYLLIGVIQHLFIAFAMGLPSFGFIMVIAYAAFYSPFKKT